MHEIKIYGEIIPFEDNWMSEYGGYVNLSEVQRQLNEAGGKDVKVRIKSFGGDVGTGFDIYTELRSYAKKNEAKIVTYGESQLASIATIIFLAGDQRILAGHSEPFVHNAWTYAMGDEKQIRKVADDLEKCNKKLAEHYALHTDLSVDEALELMSAETTISVDEAVLLRFATEKEEVFRPLALKRITNNNNYKQTNETMKNKLNRLALNLISESKRLCGAKAKKVMTATEVEIDFVDLADDAVIAVEDYATVDNVAAEGDYVMKSGETYSFEKGYLKVITEKEEDADENDDDTANDSTQALVDTITALNAKLVEQNLKLAKFENAKSPSAIVEPKAPAAKVVEVEATPNRAAAAIQKMNELKNKK